MTAGEFKSAIRALGYSVEHTSGAYHILKDGKIYARVSRFAMRCIDTFLTGISKMNDKDGLSLMALLFEFSTTPIEEREDYNYRIYTMFEENGNVGHKLYVSGYGDNGEKLALDVDVTEAMNHPKAMAEMIMRHVGRITGNEFNLEKVER